jgi:hypothetical protein
VNNFLNSIRTQPFRIRIGYWDATASTEPLFRMEVNSAAVVIHPQFNSTNLRNDIALIRTSAVIPLGKYPNIASICLPSAQVTDIRLV